MKFILKSNTSDWQVDLEHSYTCTHETHTRFIPSNSAAQDQLDIHISMTVNWLDENWNRVHRRHRNDPGITRRTYFQAFLGNSDWDYCESWQEMLNYLEQGVDLI